MTYRHLLEVSCGENIKDKNHLSYCYAVYVFDINNSTIKEYGLPVESPPLDIEHSYFESI